MVYSYPNNLVTQNMSLEETKALFESKSNEATKKYHVKIYREFAKLCHILIKRPLTEAQKSTIDEELKSYRLKAVEENTYSKHRKKLNRFKKFLGKILIPVEIKELEKIPFEVLPLTLTNSGDSFYYLYLVYEEGIFS